VVVQFAAVEEARGLGHVDGLDVRRQGARKSLGRRGVLPERHQLDHDQAPESGGIPRGNRLVVGILQVRRDEYRRDRRQPEVIFLNCTRSKKNGSSRTPANTVMPEREAIMGVAPLLTGTVAVSGPSITRLVAPIWDAGAGPRKCIT